MSKQKEKEAHFIAIDVKQQNSDLSAMLDSSYTYTILETCNESLFREVSKIELTEDRIYIFDRRSNIILIFDKRGNFISRIDKTGRGPGEYISLYDMEVLNSNVYALDGRGIIVYSEDGTFVKKINLDAKYNYFHIINDRLMILYSGKSNTTMYDFALFDYVDEMIIERFSPYKMVDSYGGYRSPFYPTDANELLMATEYDYNIYSFFEDNVDKKYTLEFNTKDKFPNNYKDIPQIELNDQLGFINVVTRVDCLNESEGYIALTFPLFHDTWGIRTHFVLINRLTRETKHIRLGDKIDSLFPYFSNPKLIKNGTVVCSLNAFNIHRIEEIVSISHFKNKISEEDNPVLFFYKLKHW